ncbi:hypothetical protein ACJX0J_021866 [Zea mays]
MCKNHRNHHLLIIILRKCPRIEQKNVQNLDLNFVILRGFMLNIDLRMEMRDDAFELKQKCD